MISLFWFIDTTSSPQVLSNSYDKQSFGNAVVELTGDRLRLRVTRDRSQLFVDLSPPDRFDWFDEHVVLQCVGAEAEAEALVAAEWRELKPSADALERNFDKIAQSLDPKNWPVVKEVLQTLQHRRADKLFGPLSRKH